MPVGDGQTYNNNAALAVEAFPHSAFPSNSTRGLWVGRGGVLNVNLLFTLHFFLCSFCVIMNQFNRTVQCT